MVTLNYSNDAYHDFFNEELHSHFDKQTQEILKLLRFAQAGGVEVTILVNDYQYSPHSGVVAKYGVPSVVVDSNGHTIVTLHNSAGEVLFSCNITDDSGYDILHICEGYQFIPNQG